MRGAERVYGFLLLAYPRAFREDVGGEMRAMFRGRYREERVRGLFAMACFWTRTLWDTAANAMPERMAAWRSRKAQAAPAVTVTKGHAMDTLSQDVRYAMRALVRTPAFTLVTVLTLALGVGANTAMFSAVNAVLLRPLPFADPERLVMVWARTETSSTLAASWPEFLDWREQNRTLADLAVWRGQSVNLTGTGEPERLIGTFVSARFFPMLGVRPHLGRSFEPLETEPGTVRPVTLISYGLWQRRFGADPAILGRSLILNGHPLTVVGVMGPDMEPGRAPFNAWFMSTEAWIPVPYFPNAKGLERGQSEMLVVARLKPGARVEEAQSDLAVVARRLEQAYPETHKGRTVSVVPLHQQFVDPVRRGLLVLLGAVGLVLLIACANLANLLLARASQRHREMAVRSALGAGRRRLVRQLLTESLLLSAVGGGLGLLLGYWGVRGLSRLTAAAMSGLPQDVGLDGRVLAFTAGLSMLTGILFGLAPALQASRPDLSAVLKEGRGAGAGAGRRRFRDALVVWEVALSLVLLIGAGLLLQSALALQGIDPGFRPQRLLTLEFRLPPAKYREPSQIAAFFRQALERVHAISGVEGAALVRALPFSGNAGGEAYAVEGRAEPPVGKEPVAQSNIVSPDYFRTMGIPLLRGRSFTERDTAETPAVIIINATMARQVWPDGDPLGKRLRLKDRDKWGTVVGIVGDVKHSDLAEEPRAQLYSTHEQDARIFASLVVRTPGDPMAMAPAVRQAIWSVDRDQPVWKVRPIEQMMQASLGPARAMATLVGVFAAASLLLAAIGLYGVMSYAVASRTREIGIRVALGAPARAVVRMVVGRGLALTGLAVLLGVAGAAALSRALMTLLVGVRPTDVSTFVGAAAVMGVVSLLACWLPARRAARVDPVVALAAE